MNQKHEFAALHTAARTNPICTPDEALPSEHMRHVANGWWVGLSINA